MVLLGDGLHDLTAPSSFCESQIVFAVKKLQGKDTYFCGCVMLYDHIPVQLLLHVQMAEPVTGIFTLPCK